MPSLNLQRATSASLVILLVAVLLTTITIRSEAMSAVLLRIVTALELAEKDGRNMTIVQLYAATSDSDIS